MPKAEDKPQIEKFREAARALGLDDPVEFEAAVITVAKAPKITDQKIKEVVKAIKKAKKEQNPRAP